MVEKNKCLCHAKLVEIHSTISKELHDCKEDVWNFKITNLQRERDSLLLRNNNLRCQLADLHSKIVSDPFMARRYRELCDSSVSGTSKLENQDNPNKSQLYKQLYIFADHNKELEERLSCEQMTSMTWKHRFNDLENKIATQVAELLELTQGEKCVEEIDYKKFKTDHYCKVLQEALQLLKLAKARIDGDRHRIESYMDRVSDLEDKLSEYRMRFSDAKMA
ncbi:conserved hypothetical protein [Theileria orientalis strain Shintoku]|uniref:Uncharacterized protein n=1 Tax=Theileria orientalis strain Shintoku TaxID=869250 RepID=J4DP77_THEOR|nr:conserved hypothetical protein [Theileria orientalis strain Shintoku]PVC51654.1 hypothetical protein MACL_00001457 [Theileria orientalis]BAM40229.1 conserved hypothetical protein [Theileria orientalis strain Shintoku]|eukprot:XP_009690530.1 conserved hypothetical protein [Theileria orientalis strain Shintoku]